MAHQSTLKIFGAAEKSRIEEMTYSGVDLKLKSCPVPDSFKELAYLHFSGSFEASIGARSFPQIKGNSIRTCRMSVRRFSSMLNQNLRFPPLKLGEYGNSFACKFMGSYNTSAAAQDEESKTRINSP
jgi:hypothetical protein